MIDQGLVAALRRSGIDAESAVPIGGGDVSRALRLRARDGSSFFVKTHPTADGAIYAAEADGLQRIASCGGVRFPAVIAVGARAEGTPPFIALEWIDGQR